MEQSWWTSETTMVDQWKIMVEQWNRYGGTVEQLWRNSGTDIVEKCKRDGGTVEQ